MTEVTLLKQRMLQGVVWLLILVGFSLCQNCTPNEVIGCLNGVPYVKDSQFPVRGKKKFTPLIVFSTKTEFRIKCGNHVYIMESHGCCGQAIPFNSTSQFCCYSGVHDFSNSTCQRFGPENKSINLKLQLKKIKLHQEKKQFENKQDTEKFGDEPCTTGTEEYGCLNGKMGMYLS